MMAASVGVTPTFHASSPLKLFDASVYWPGIQTGRAFDVAPDGRFIFIKEVNDPWRKPPVVAVLNWVDDLKSKSRR